MLLVSAKRTLFCVLLGACAARGKPPMMPGDSAAEAQLDTLPSLDVNESELSAEMHKALALSEDSIELGLPELPKGEATSASWTDTRLKDWLRDKHRRTQTASAALDLAGAQSPRQRMLSGAVAGLVFENAARDLLQVPPPSDLPLDLETIAVFREIMQGNASVCVEQAQLAYKACADNAREMPELLHWEPFCVQRAQRLPSPTSTLTQQ
jgi:hypothetical protein